MNLHKILYASSGIHQLQVSGNLRDCSARHLNLVMALFLQSLCLSFLASFFPSGNTHMIDHNLLKILVVGFTEIPAYGYSHCYLLVLVQPSTICIPLVLLWYFCHIWSANYMWWCLLNWKAYEYLRGLCFFLYYYQRLIKYIYMQQRHSLA